MRIATPACVLTTILGVLLCSTACGRDKEGGPGAGAPVVEAGREPAAEGTQAAPAPTSIAQRARALACASLEALPEFPMRALLLARAGARAAVLPETIEALLRSLEASRTTRPFAEHAGSTLEAIFAPEGDAILTTSLDMNARLWDVDGAPLALFRGHEGSIHKLSFRPDGERILTASVDHTAREWARDGTLVRTLRDHQAEVLSARYAPGGRVATVSMDGKARLWSADGLEHAFGWEDELVADAWPTSGGPWAMLVLLQDAGAAGWGPEGDASWPFGDIPNDVAAVIPDADGRRFALLTDRAPVLLFDAHTNTQVVLEGHAAQALDAAFSPTEDLVATAAQDATARLWAPDGTPGPVLEGHGGAVFHVAFSDDGTRLLTVSSDRSARVWDRSGRLLVTLGGPATPVVSAAFSPDGQSILTTPWRQGRARIWNLDGTLRLELPDDTGRTSDARWSPDGTRVLALDRTATPRLWTVDPTHLLATAETLVDREFTRSEKRRFGPLLASDGGAAGWETDLATLRPPLSTEGTPLRGDFAGTVECAACHRDAYEGWTRSSHARTSYFPSPQDLPEDVLEERTVSHPPFTTTYRREGDGWVAVTTGEDGTPTSFPLSMISGHLRIRFFVTRMPDGRYQVLPGMYELPTGDWFDYTHLIFGADTGDFDTPPTIEPGSATFWTGPVRSWGSRCAHCHMSGKEAVAREAGEIGPRVVWRAYAVDCEACHDAGRLHAEAWRRLEMDEPMPRLERLPREERVALCTQCHQEGEVLSPPFALGDDLYEYIDPTVVVDPERSDPAGRPTELIYDGLPFATSTCAEAGGLTCSYCHAPHGSSTRSLLRRPADDGWLCAECHGDLVENAEAHHHHQPTGSGASCVLCHMPFLTIERGHGAVADHTIGIPRLGLVADRVQPDACTWCHEGLLGAPSDAPSLTEEELWRAYEDWWPDAVGWPQPWMDVLASARLGDEGAWERLAPLTSDHALPREVRASAALLLGRYLPEARTALLAASRDEDSLVRRNAIKALADLRDEGADQRLLEALEDPSWAVRVAAARTALGGWSRVQANRPLLEAVVPVLAEDAKRVPDDDRRWFRLGAAYDLLGDREEALRAYERKVALDPLAEQVQKHVQNLRALLGHDQD